MQKILVTGGCGFIGRHLVRLLLGQGCEVVVLDDLSTGRKANLPDHPNLYMHKGSVLDTGALTDLSPGLDLVLHLAGVVGMRLAVAQQDLSYRVADRGTELVLGATGNVPVVLFSSSAVYGLVGNSPSPEDLEVGLDSALAYDGGQPGYSAGKVRLEERGREAAQRGRQVLIVRPFNVVGPGQVGAYGMVLPTFVDRAYRGMPLEVYGDGGQSRTFSAVSTFCQALWQLLAKPAAWQLPGRVINLGATTPTRINCLAEMVLRIAGTSGSIHRLPYERVFPGRRDVQARVPEIGRLTDLLGPITWPGIESIVRAVCQEWVSQNPGLNALQAGR